MNGAAPAAAGKPMRDGWVHGAATDTDIPAHPEALLEGGAPFLTRAFRATGSLAADNSVTAIRRAESFAGGSTGSKLLLDVEYAQHCNSLHDRLFAKFSRAFDNPARDNARLQMRREVRFALLSRQPGFPIRVPTCYCADWEDATGTGLLVTERIAFGEGGIEPHRDKCRDYELDAPLERYRTIVRALGRLAAWDRAGRLPPAAAEDFPFAPDELTVGAQQALTRDELLARVERYRTFATDYPALLPRALREGVFVERLRTEAPVLLDAAPRVLDILMGEPALVALCHWNANIDNAWFWRDGAGELDCGLLDWGNVSRMNVGMALWGCLSGAEVPLWDDHLQDLLALFAREYRDGGGPALAPALLDRHMRLYALLMGVNWLLDVPAYVRRRLPGLPGTADRLHAEIAGDETLRVRLQMLTVFLNLWHHTDIEALLHA